MARIPDKPGDGLRYLFVPDPRDGIIPARAHVSRIPSFSFVFESFHLCYLLEAIRRRRGKGERKRAIRREIPYADPDQSIKPLFHGVTSTCVSPRALSACRREKRWGHSTRPGPALF